MDKVFNSCWIVAVFFILYLFLPLATYNHNLPDGDTAEYLNNPLRVLNGEMPYRDFWLLFPPGEVFLPAFIYKVFGLNINILLIFLILIRALTGIASFFLGRLAFRNDFYAALASLLVFFNGAGSIVYFLPLIISAIFFIKYLSNNALINILLSGISIGAAFLFDVYVVGGTFLAYLLSIFIRVKFDRKPFRYFIKSVLLFCGGVLFVIVPPAVLLRQILMPMMREVFKEALSHGTSINLPYFYTVRIYLEPLVTALKDMIETGSIRYITKFLLNICHIVVALISYLLPFLIMCASIWYLRGRRLNKPRTFLSAEVFLRSGKVRGEDKIIVSFFLLWGVFTFPKALGRADIGHLFASITALFFPMVFFMQKNFLSRLFAVIICLLLLSVPLEIFDTLEDLMAPHYEADAPYGKFLLTNEMETRQLNNIINFIGDNTVEGDYIFVTPWFSPPFYAMMNRKNPAYYDSLIDLVARPSEKKQLRVCNDLLKRDTKLIIHCREWGFDNKKELSFLYTCPVLQRCIEKNFIAVKEYGCYTIYRKN